MDTVACLIVDDEPIARDIIRNYCNQLSYLDVKGACSNAMEAKLILQQQKIEIVFLDINMPVMDGLSFLKTLKNPPQIIFTTAYKEYAINAFDLAACDYLLKPFSLERFMIAIDRAMEKLQPRAAETIAATPVPVQYVFIKADGKIYKIDCNDLLYAEASGNYTKIVTAGNIISPNMSFSAVAELLPNELFIRVHRSFIINKSRISHLEGNRVYINKTEIPIGSNYKDAFLKELGFSS